MRRQMRLSGGELRSTLPLSALQRALAPGEVLEPGRLRVVVRLMRTEFVHPRIYRWNFGEEVYAGRLSYIRDTCGDYGELLPS
jgi:hypothetical protein